MKGVIWSSKHNALVKIFDWFFSRELCSPCPCQFESCLSLIITIPEVVIFCTQYGGLRCKQLLDNTIFYTDFDSFSEYFLKTSYFKEMSRAQSRMSARTGGGSRAASAKSTKSARHHVVIHSTVLPMSKAYLGKEYEQRLANAAGEGDLIAVIKILKFNVSPDSRDENGQPALVKACMGKRTMW